MRLAVAALALMAVLTPLRAAAAPTGQAAPTLADVLGGFANYNAATGPNLPGSNGYVAQDISNRMFGSLQKVLTGAAPTLNFVPQTDPAGQFNALAHPALNRIDLSSKLMLALVDPSDVYHGVAVNGLPHEMMHLRQSADTIADHTKAEGGAQAFADLVTPDAAKAANEPYTLGAYDGPYAPLVQLVQQQYGRDWILGGQMGRPPVAWP